MVFELFNITLASYVGAMIVGIIIRNVMGPSLGLDLPIQEIDTSATSA